MSAGELLERLSAKLDQAGVPYMVAGSFASTYHGIPRSTHDIDLVVDLTPDSLRALLALFPEEDYYVDADAAREALRLRSQFNVIDMASGWKIDLVVRKARAFSIEEFQRRQPAEILGARVFVASAEDSIVAKLEWSKLGSSERQIRDVAGILSVRATTLDMAYIERWVAELGLADGWAEARSAAGISAP